MNTIEAATLSNMTISMLERTAMVLAEPAVEGDVHPPATRFARIVYRGPSSGTLVLGATEGFLRELAASLLGVESMEINIDIQGSDALREMANIVGGSVILALAGGVCEYSLGLPELVASAEQPAGTVSVEATVVAEGGVLRVLWTQYNMPIAA